MKRKITIIAVMVCYCLLHIHAVCYLSRYDRYSVSYYLEEEHPGCRDDARARQWNILDSLPLVSDLRAFVIRTSWADGHVYKEPWGDPIWETEPPDWASTHNAMIVLASPLWPPLTFALLALGATCSLYLAALLLDAIDLTEYVVESPLSSIAIGVVVTFAATVAIARIRGIIRAIVLVPAAIIRLVTGLSPDESALPLDTHPFRRFAKHVSARHLVGQVQIDAGRVDIPDWPSLIHLAFVVHYAIPPNASGK